MKTTVRVLLAIVSLALSSPAQVASVPPPPNTPKHPVGDSYHGVQVTDDYRWLENWDDPAVKQWSTAQNARTRQYLDHLPDRLAIHDRLQHLFSATSARYYDLQFRGGTLFAMKFQPPLQQPILIALHSADEPNSAKVIFDPNAANEKGSLAVDFYRPSLDGKYVALALSENGSEDSNGRVIEVATGHELSDVVPRVNFATGGGSIDWKADNSGFYYTRYPQGNERPPEDANFYQQVYFHKLGSDPKTDAYVIGKDFPRIAEIHLSTSDDGQWLVATVANGDGGEFAHYVMDAAGHWTQVTRFRDRITSAKIGGNDALFLLSLQNAPRGKILRLDRPNLPLSQAKVVVPETPGKGSEAAKAAIESFEPSGDLLYVTKIAGGPSVLFAYDNAGRPTAINTPPVSAIDEVVHLPAGNVLARISSFLDPPGWWTYDPAQKKLSRTALVETSAIKFDDTEVIRAFATSKDGTRVPLNIIRRKGTKLDGTNPTLLYAYGGYAISETPHFVGPLGRVWLDQGGVYVIANLRGGGEYGDAWHKAGNLTRKQNVFDDFIASAEYLIQQKYTSPEHLTIMGGSNGGLLMGAAFTQRPDLFRAVVSFVGIYDMLRVELDPNGAFNVTEFGSVKDPEQFKALYAYSPYHHVKDHTAYPAVLFLTGENDHRVNPMQSRKMTARLQAATSSNRPILLRTSSNAGHGMGTALAEQIEQLTDVFSFLFDQLGMKYNAAQK